MKIFRTSKKYLAIGLCVALVLFYSLPIAGFAQEVTPTPEPSPQTQIEQNADQQNNVDTVANTGDNSIGPTPTPTTVLGETVLEVTPTPTPTEAAVDNLETEPAPQASISASQSAEVTNQTQSSTDTGNNTISNNGSSAAPAENQNSDQPTAEPTPTVSQIQTGDAVAITTVDNAINTTQINSQIVYQTINIFLDQSGNIDLTDPAGLAQFIATNHPDEEVVNLVFTDIKNTAEVTNSINSTANTGGNTIAQEGGSAQITTGDAYSLITMLNRINLVMVDSVLHIVTINIFGNFTGNIILPDLVEADLSEMPCADCPQAVTVESNATVNNVVNSQAVTGQNTIEGDEGEADIQTGNATNYTALVNFVNTTLIGGNLVQLYINPFGFWQGSFLGWGSLENSPPGQTPGCPTCSGNLSVDSQATLTNNISSTANTGGNYIAGTGESSITTGQAFNVVALLNLVNTNLIRSSGFFGFINIFGSWTGNIGGAEFFTAEEVIEETTAQTETQNTENETTEQNNQFTPEEGGQLSLTQSNNVGAYVLPGDTVTFFLKAKNIGTGRVYQPTLDLTLIKDGKNMGGAHFALSDIDPGRGVKITTGLVLSPKTPAGVYLARAIVRGRVGAANSEVKAVADSTFLVFGLDQGVFGTTENTNPPVEPQVLGVTQQASTAQEPNILQALAVLLLLIPAYTSLRGYKEKEKLLLVFTRNVPWQERLRAFQIFLL